MYLIEAIIKYIKGKKFKSNTKYNPQSEQELTDNPQDCVHFFMPLDSSNEFFACKHCGLVVKAKDLKS